MPLSKSPLVIAIFALAAGVTLAAEPSSSTLTEVDPHIEGDSGVVQQISSQKLRLTFAPGADLPTANDLRELVQRIRWSTSNRPDVVLRVMVDNYAPLHNQAILNYSICTPQASADWFGPNTKAVPPDAKEADKIFQQGLHSIVTEDAKLTPDQRSARITAVVAELTQVRAMKQALQAMASSQPSQADALSKRITALQEENQRLSMTLSAKEARQQALQRTIANIRLQNQQDQQSDPVIEQLRTVVKLRESEVKHLEGMRNGGVATDSDLTEGQAKLADARVKLAEREAAGGKAGKGELLDHLADEMTMTAVDLTDLQIQLDHVRDQLHSLNPSSATTQSLEEVLKNGSIPQGKDAASLPPLFGQLEERERSLVREKVVLEIDDVQPVADSR